MYVPVVYCRGMSVIELVCVNYLDVFDYTIRRYLQVADKLMPYLRLYTNGVEFSEKYDSWMNAPVSGT